MPQPGTRSRIAIGDTSITFLPDGFGAHNPAVLFPGADWTTRSGYLEVGQLKTASSPMRCPLGNCVTSCSCFP